MRTLRFSWWQMLLVLVLVLSMAVDVVLGAQTVFPDWRTPWLFPLLALVALDAVATQWVVVRERLNFAEQGALRVVEVALLVVAVRVASVLAEEIPLREVMEPWLRDPFSFFSGRFGEYFGIAFLVWLAASMLTYAVLHVQAELPRAGVRSLPNEEAAAVQDRVLALARFDRYWLLCTLIALAGAAVALSGTRLVGAFGTWRTAEALLGVVSCVAAGLLLHSQGQFDVLRYRWHIEQTIVDANISRRWLRTNLLLIVGALVLGVIGGALALFAPAPPLVPLLNVLLVVMAFVLAIVIGLFGLLLLPFAWLLSLATGNTSPITPVIPNIQPPQLPNPVGERPLLPALIFWLCVILLVGMAGLRYVQQRQDLRMLLGRWRGTRWLLRVFGIVWNDLLRWSEVAAQTVRQRLVRPRRRVVVRKQVPRGSQGQLRALYRKMVRTAERRGVYRNQSQTPNEFRTALAAAVPPADPDAAGLTEAYVVAEYGPRPAEPPDVRRARTHWRRLERILARGRTKKPD